MKNLIMIAIAIVVCSCQAKDEKKDKQNRTGQAVGAHNHANSTHGHEALAGLPLNELLEVNRDISARLREDFRSWSYNEPDRWPYLADKFVGEVVRSCPDASANKEKIAGVYLTYLQKRAVVYHSNEKNKQALMGQLSADFKYNLSFLIGIEGYQKWEVASKNQIARFNQMRDSLNTVIAFSDKKYQELNKQRKP
jgi:hypothetical protein